MSLPAVSRQATIDPAICAARLIPGCGTPNSAPRRGPALVWSNQVERSPSETSPANHLRLTTSIANVLLPRLSTNDTPSELWPVLLNDYVAILGSWVCVAAVAALPDQTGEFSSSPSLIAEIMSAHTPGALLFSVVTTLLGHSEGLYRCGVDRRSRTLILAKSVAWTMLVLGATMSGLGTPAFSVRQLVLSAGLSLGTLLLSREIRDRAQRTRHASGTRERNVLIVGAGAAGREGWPLIWSATRS